MAAWTKERKLDALMEIIAEHKPIPGITLWLCTCGVNGDSRSGPRHWDHLREMIANEGLLDDDPGARR